MTEEAEPLEAEEPAIESVEQDKRGSLMSERESWERVREGLALAADGARHMARHREPDPWNRLALYLDSLRKAVTREAGFDHAQAGKTSGEAWGGARLSVTQAHRRVSDGLRSAAAGAKQISLGQRMDLRWHMYAESFDKLRDSAHKLALDTSPLRTAAGWRNTASGLVVPTTLH